MNDFGPFRPRLPPEPDARPIELCVQYHAVADMIVASQDAPNDGFHCPLREYNRLIEDIAEGDAVTPAGLRAKGMVALRHFTKWADASGPRAESGPAIVISLLADVIREVGA